MRNKRRTTPIDTSSPWKFHVDQAVYVWGFDQEFTFTVAEKLKLGPANFPHYIVTSIDGEKWTVPQMHLSRKPIVPR